MKFLLFAFLFQPGRVHLSDTSYALLKDSEYFDIEYKGRTELKVKERKKNQSFVK